MLQSIQIEPETLESNTASLKFAEDDIRTGGTYCAALENWIIHKPGTATYKIIRGGTYTITFNANVTSANAGVVGLALLDESGEVIPGTEVNADVATANNYSNVGFNKSIIVCVKEKSTFTIKSIGTVNGVATQIPTVKNANLAFITPRM